MRRFGLVLTTLLLAGWAAQAQTPPATPTPGTTPAAGGPGAVPVAPAAADSNLDRYLLRWEQEMRRVQTLAAQISRTDKDKSFGATHKYVGGAYYMKSGSGPTSLNLGLLELRLEGKPDIAEKFVCTGTYVYQYVPAQKEIRAYEVPRPRPGQVADDNWVAFLFGMKAEEARRRYDMKVAKEDTHYIYIDIAPRFAPDKADFSRARLVLFKETFLPRFLWFEHPNGNEVSWDINRMQSGAALDRRIFDAPRAPAGWKVVPVPRTPPPGGDNPPPRVIRPSGEPRP